MLVSQDIWLIGQIGTGDGTIIAFDGEIELVDSDLEIEVQTLVTTVLSESFTYELLPDLETETTGEPSVET